MASELHVRIYYYLRVLLQDVSTTLDHVTTKQENPDLALLHSQIVNILNVRVKPLLNDKSLADDGDIAGIKERLGDAIYTSKRGLNALTELRNRPSQDEQEKRQAIRSATQEWMKQWISAIGQCTNNTLAAYIHSDLIEAVNHVMNLIRAATLFPNPGARINNLAQFVTRLVPVSNPAADSPIHRANLAVLKAVQGARLDTAGAIAAFLREDFAATADLMNQLQGDPNRATVQNVCIDCGRIVRSPRYFESSERFVCAKTDPLLHVPAFIQKCGILTQERKSAASASSYLSKEREGVHFETPASFTSWVNSENCSADTERLYVPRATATEMCHLSRNGYLGAFNRLWNLLPYESRLFVLNCSLRGHHIDAFPDLWGRSTIQLDASSVITFLSHKVVRDDKALERVIESRDEKKKAVPRKVSRLNDAEIGPPIAFEDEESLPLPSSSLSQGVPPSYSSSSQGLPPPYSSAIHDNEEEEEVKVYTERRKPEVLERDIVQRADLRVKESERWQKRPMLADETDDAVMLQEIKVEDIVTSAQVFDEGSENESSVSNDSEAEVSSNEESSDSDGDIEMKVKEEERSKKRTVDDIRAEIGVQAEIEQVAMAGSGDNDVRTAWTFTYRDMKNALYLLATTRTRLDVPPSPAQLKILAQLILYRVLPPSDQIANIKIAADNVSVLVHQDTVAPTQHSRLFERRLETTAAQLGPVKQENKNVIDHELLRSAQLVIAAATGNDRKEPREDLQPVAVYLAHIGRKKTPWAQIRRGNLSEFPDDVVPDTDKENELAKTMQPFFSYATGLFPVYKANASNKGDTYNEILNAVWKTEYKLVEGIADGILPPIEAEDAWDRLAETSPRRLESMMRVLSKVFGDAAGVYLTKRDWAGLIITTDSLIRRSTSEVFASKEAEEYEFRIRKKDRQDPRFFTKDYSETLMKRVDDKARVFNVKDYAKMASNMLYWISIIVPRDLRLLQRIAWQAPYDNWVFDQLRRYRVLHGLRPPNLDEDKQDDAEREMANSLSMMEKDILTEIRSLRRSDNDQKEAARGKFFGGRNVSLGDLQAYVDLWGKVHNPRDQTRLTLDQQTDALNELSRLERTAFPEAARIEAATQKLRVAKETLASLVHDASIFTDADVYNALEDTKSTLALVHRLKTMPGIDSKIIDAADKVVSLRETIDAEKRTKDRIFFLGQWIYTKRRILNNDIYGELEEEKKDPEAKLHADLELSAREVFPQVLEIESLNHAQRELIATLDENTRTYINNRSDRELRGMVKKADANANFNAEAVTEVLRLRSETRKLENDLEKDQQILVDFVIERRNAAQETEDPELRVSQRIKLFQRLLFAVGYIWPTLGQSAVGNVPTELIKKINEETREVQKASSLHRYMVIVDPVVAETIWSETPVRQIMDAKKPLDYKVSLHTHSRDFLQRRAKDNPILVRSLFTMYREMGYPWQDDDFRFVLQWNYNDTDTTFECFNKLIETCRRPENTRWRRMLVDMLSDEKLDLELVYLAQDPRRVHSRLRESVLERIPLSDREIRFLLYRRWNQLGPDELANFPKLTESQILFVNQHVVDNASIQRFGPINALGIHKLYVFSRLTPDGMKNVFNPEVKVDEAYRIIDEKGMALKVTRKNSEACEFEGLPNVWHKIAKVRPYGPFFKGAANVSFPKFYIGNVEVSSDLYHQLN